MHYQGLEGMPRRVADYAPQFGWSNTVISIAAFILGASTLIMVYNFIHSARHGKPAGANPWGSLTLEWQLSSPPPIFNFPTTQGSLAGAQVACMPGLTFAIKYWEPGGNFMGSSRYGQTTFRPLDRSKP